MEKINPSEYEKRLERMGDILADIAQHADQQALMRCPYKNRFNQCTAQFGCRFKRKPRRQEDLPVCTSDDQLDYRSAWAVHPDEVESMRAHLRESNSRRGSTQAHGHVSHEGKRFPSSVSQTIFDFADELQVRVPTSCGRSGHCHECVVEICQGLEALSDRSEAEAFLSGNYRLACQAVVEDADAEVEFSLLRRSPKILTPQPTANPNLDPVVTRRGDKVTYDGEVIDSYRDHIYGLAVDIGTTTVVAELVDLESGQPVYLTSFENPQRFGGSDVLHRISYDVGANAGELHQAIINTLNGEIEAICRQLSIDRHVIYELVVVGNATMRDLFFGLDVQSIGQRPYKSLVENEYLEGKRSTTSLVELARKLRIRANRHARVFGAPLIASHVGGDIVADLVAVDMPRQTKLVMLVDAGTNTEVVLGNKDRLLAASCPAGPAFEGGLVRFGMPGCEGAIESLTRSNGHWEYQTIGNVEPRGICGSGLIDLLAELRRNDLMTPRGVFAERAHELPIVPDHGITFSRQDASHLAQAKAANYCGQIILMRNFGVTPDQIECLYLAGGFANYVRPECAIDIGFIAPVPVERIQKVGNAAAQGAREMLLSRTKRDEIERLIKTIEHVELETMPDFFDCFVDGCHFDPMTLTAK